MKTLHQQIIADLKTLRTYPLEELQRIVLDRIEKELEEYQEFSWFTQNYFESPELFDLWMTNNEIFEFFKKYNRLIDFFMEGKDSSLMRKTSIVDPKRDLIRFVFDESIKLFDNVMKQSKIDPYILCK